MRLALAALACLLLTGCLDWQAGYDNQASAQCRENVDASARQACLDRVQQNSSRKRADRRG